MNSIKFNIIVILILFSIINSTPAKEKVDNYSVYAKLPLLGEVEVQKIETELSIVDSTFEYSYYVAPTKIVDFFDKSGNYKLAQPLEGAYKAANPNQFQKDFIETDRRINLLYSALEGKVLRIFPVPESENDKWVSFHEATDYPFEGVDSLYVANVMPLYLGALRQGAYEQADELLESISGFQRKYGNDIMPSASFS